MSTASISPGSVEWSILSLANSDPFPAYEVLRKRGPIVWDPGMNCWLVLSYDLCRAVESDESTYRIILAADKGPLASEIAGGKTSVGQSLGEKHARMRRLSLRLLGPAAMPRYRTEHVLPVVNDAIDRFANRGHAELINEFAIPIPPRVMASLFGLPWKDDALMANISQWHDDIVAWVGMGYPNDELARKAKHASDELNKVFLPLVVDRRERRGDDFISAVWTHAPTDYGEVGVEDVISIVREMALGAGETTTKAIANSTYLLLSNPVVREAVSIDQQGALNAFVEEVLRLLGSLQWRFRLASCDLSLAGSAIKKNDRIMLLHAAANRDPEHYACPHMIDLNRRPPTDHLAFNVGTRICVGMHLARLQIRESLKALIIRLPNFYLDQGKETPQFRGFSHRSFGPQHVVF